MKPNTIRAWKDEAYRQSLSSEERALLPESPVGATELTDADLQVIHGGKDGVAISIAVCSVVSCLTSNIVIIAINSDIVCQGQF